MHLHSMLYLHANYFPIILFIFFEYISISLIIYADQLFQLSLFF